jgi:hypothetical protein
LRVSFQRRHQHGSHLVELGGMDAGRYQDPAFPGGGNEIKMAPQLLLIQ